MRPSSRASWASRRWWACENATHRARAPATRSPCPAPRAIWARSTRARSRSRSSAPISRSCRRPATQIMVNLGNPELAFKTSFLPNDGVGLARMEFIITEHIKVHPMALVHPERVDGSGGARHDRRALTRGYARPADFFVERSGRGRGHDRRGVLSEARDRAHVRLQDQRVRDADRRPRFEPTEENPMLGLPRRLALRASRVRRGLRARVRRHEARARDDGAHQRQAHDPLLPPRRGGRAGARRPWRSTGSARRATGSRSTSCARSPTT